MATSIRSLIVNRGIRHTNTQIVKELIAMRANNVGDMTAERTINAALVKARQGQFANIAVAKAWVEDNYESFYARPSLEWMR